MKFTLFGLQQQRPEIIDKAIQIFAEKAYCINTYRPCYATLVPKVDSWEIQSVFA